MSVGERTVSAGAAGYEGSPAEALAAWERDAERWHSVGSPWRPSAGDVALYRELAGARLGGRVLVLGVTPELRDLVADAGGQPVLVDRSPAMHAAATGLLRRAEPADETWIEGDWCDPSVPSDAFDLVVGDMIWWTVSVSKQRAVTQAIHAALKMDGLLVGRVRFTDPNRAAQSVVSEMRRFLSRLDRAPEDERLLRGAMYSWLYDRTTDGEFKRLDRGRAYSLVLELAARPEFARHEKYLRGFAARLPGPDWTSQSRDDLLGTLCERFEIVREGRAADYESSSYPVIALGPI